MTRPFSPCSPVLWNVAVASLIALFGCESSPVDVEPEPDVAPADTNGDDADANTDTEFSAPDCTVEIEELSDESLRVTDDISGDGFSDWGFSNEEEIRSGPPPGALVATVENYLRLPVVLHSADLNANGHRDIVAAEFSDTDRVVVFFGPFDDEPVLDFDDPSVEIFYGQAGELVGFAGYQIETGDLTGNGYDDLLVTTPSYEEVFCLGMEPAAIYEGPLEEGSLTLEDAHAWMPLADEDSVDIEDAECLGRRAHIADVDGDGALDVVLSNLTFEDEIREYSRTVVYDGPFDNGGERHPDHVQTPGAPVSLRDVTDDGRKELLVEFGSEYIYPHRAQMVDLDGNVVADAKIPKDEAGEGEPPSGFLFILDAPGWDGPGPFLLVRREDEDPKLRYFHPGAMELEDHPVVLEDIDESEEALEPWREPRLSPAVLSDEGTTDLLVEGRWLLRCQ